MPLKQRAELHIEVAQQISIPKNQLTRSTTRFLRDKLFIMNSEYFIKERLGKPVYNVAKFFDLIEEAPPFVLLPRGFLNQLTDFLNKENIPYTITYRHPELKPCAYNSSIALTPGQNHITQQALSTGQGVIVAPPGSGKTIMGLELIAKHQKPALILTHRQQLLDQWVEHIEKYFTLPKKQIGTYSAGRKKIGEQITVGLLQSFARSKNLDELANRFGVIVVDECHHIPAKTFRAVMTHLNASHVYGLTATPKRKHNDEQLIYLYIGEIVATMKSNRIMAPTSQEAGLEITICETSLTLPFNWKTDQYELLAKVVCYDTSRNNQIIKDVLNQVRLKQRILVLSERKEHLQILNLYLRSHCKTIVFTGDDTVKERAAKVKQINGGEYAVLLATGQIFGEGMHVPNIETLILAFPFAFEGKLIQYIGRLLHSSSPRQLIDYHDKEVEILEKQHKKRQRYYKKLEKTF